MTSALLPANPRICFLASTAPAAQRARELLTARHGDHAVEDADVLCALGGDGFMLQTLHRHGGAGKPVFGMKLGSVGFLMNQYRDDGDLLARLQRAEPAHLRPLEMLAQTESGTTTGSLAYNEVSLLRQTRQAAHLSVDLNGQTRIEELIGDGVLVSTPAGSTAYNYSAHGPILPLGSHTLALTPIAPYRPRRWRGAILKADTQVRFRVLDPYKRPVSVTADSHETRDVVEVTIRESAEHRVTLLFDPEHNLEERIFSEQFVV
ncbi:MAG TPA: NAD kinase [Xanthomonadaceae bacterium]|nr:NAD kinase [Xanthomonadaceae bacterium]